MKYTELPTGHVIRVTSISMLVPLGPDKTGDLYASNHAVKVVKGPKDHIRVPFQGKKERDAWVKETLSQLNHP